MTSEVKYPNVYVQLVGKDGNAYSILARVDHALRIAGYDKEVRNAFHEEATSGDYNHLLRTVMAWVSVDENDDDDDEW